MAVALRNPQPVAPDAKPARLRVQTARSLDEVDRLEPAWHDFDHHVADPLARFHWIRAALTVNSEAAPQVVVVTSGDEIVAIAPLVKRRRCGISRLCLAGVAELFEPLDLLWSDERSLARLCSALAWSGAPLWLERLPARSPSVRSLRRHFRGRAIIVARPQPACPYIPLDESWLSPELHLNSGRRSDLRRARRRAEQLGPVTTEIRTPDLSDLSGLLDTAFEIEARSWKGEVKTALAHDVNRALFYRQYAQAACTAGILRICFLRIGDRLAAMQLAVECCNAFWLLKIGYDARFAQCSPGLLLMRDTIRYSVEAGLARYEFLGLAEDWTRLWTRKEHAYVSLRIYPLGVRGMTALVADSTQAAFQKWSKKTCPL